MDEQLKSNLTSSKHWVRFLYMILFAFFLYIASFFMMILVAVQFVFALLTGAENTKLRVFGRELTLYIHQMLMFLTYNTDFKPFPFADWPGESATAVVPERDPVHEQKPRQPQSEPETASPDTASSFGSAPSTPRDTATAPVRDNAAASPRDTAPGPDTDRSVRHTTAADAEVESTPDTAPTEVTAATSVIDIEPEEGPEKENESSVYDNSGNRPELENAEDTDDDATPATSGNDRKTTRTRKKPE